MATAALALSACAADIAGAPVALSPTAGPTSNPFPTFESSLNTTRAGPGLNPLAYNAKLAAAAQVHANDMSTNGFFDHVGSDGSTFSQRISAQGYNWAWAAENIAYGYATESDVFTGWMNSPPHRANMLSAEPTEFGLARAPGNYWVLELARPMP